MRALWIVAVALAGCEGAEEGASSHGDAGDDARSGGARAVDSGAVPTNDAAADAVEPAPDATQPRADADPDPELEPDIGPRPDDPCPSDVVCVADLPFVHAADTSASARSVFDRYGCAPETDESGPEVVYRVDVAEEGFLAVRLSGMAGGTDVDVHLLGSLDADDCIDRGHWTSGAWVSPGRYWVVADSWVDAAGAALSGAYTLEMDLTRAADLEALGLAPEVAGRALRVFDAAWRAGDTRRLEYAVTDFSLHSSLPRQWIVDLATGSLLWHLHVAHGRGFVDAETATASPEFSNVSGSHLSSLGLMRAAEAYFGDYGHSFRLDGLEPGYNDNVRRRDIVMHPWTGSRPSYVAEHGWVQPTWGCPALDDRVAPAVVDALADGALLWFWFPDGDWSEQSTYLR